MPYREGHQALYHLSDSMSGANWRSMRFEDEFTLSLYACHVCRVIPSSTVLLPCSHSPCDQCATGCGGSLCPLDLERFLAEECQRIQLPARKRRDLKASILHISRLFLSKEGTC
ncbi:hypothetical protein MRX96_027602 [Rhipicephalus microplus]